MSGRNLYLLALLATTLFAQSPDPPTLPSGAKAIEVVQDGHFKLKYHFVAVGKQI